MFFLVLIILVSYLRHKQPLTFYIEPPLKSCRFVTKHQICLNCSANNLKELHIVVLLCLNVQIHDEKSVLGFSSPLIVCFFFVHRYVNLPVSHVAEVPCVHRCTPCFFGLNSCCLDISPPQVLSHATSTSGENFSTFKKLIAVQTFLKNFIRNN